MAFQLQKAICLIQSLFLPQPLKFLNELSSILGEPVALARHRPIQKILVSPPKASTIYGSKQ